MSNEVNKQAIELCKGFYKAIDKKVTPALFKQGIGQFKNLLSVYTFEELTSVVAYIEEGNMTTIYSPGYLSYATNKILDEIKLKQIKQEEKKVNTSTLEVSLSNNSKKKQNSSFLDKFI